MKKRKIFPGVPRSISSVLNIVLAIILILAFYISIGCPTFSLTQEFRRAEKAHMIGPCEIVDINTDHYEYEKLIVGESEYGVCFFGKFELTVGYKNGKNRLEDRYTLTYFEKTGDITLAVAPNVRAGLWSFANIDLPVYVFHSHPDAVWAEIEVKVVGNQEIHSNSQIVTVEYNHLFAAKSIQNEGGHFRFTLTSTSEQSAKALGIISTIASRELPASNYQDIVIPAIVRLYDADNQLIAEKTVEFRL